MFEICALLAPKKIAKPRKARSHAAKIGAKVIVWGRMEGVIIAKHENRTWWTIKIDGHDAAGWARTEFDVVA